MERRKRARKKGRGQMLGTFAHTRGVVEGSGPTTPRSDTHTGTVNYELNLWVNCSIIWVVTELRNTHTDVAFVFLHYRVRA